MKGVILPDHIPLSKYRFNVAGLPEILFTSFGAMEQELDTADLPDRTKASGGRTKAGETEVKLPMHHQVQVAAMESWFAEGSDDVDPSYKKVGTLSGISLSGLIRQTFTVFGCFLNKRTTPEFSLDNEGELAEMAYNMCWDDIL